VQTYVGQFRSGQRGQRRDITGSDNAGSSNVLSLSSNIQLTLICVPPNRSAGHGEGMGFFYFRLAYKGMSGFRRLGERLVNNTHLLCHFNR
jgi:hypothetical protein